VGDDNVIGPLADVGVEVRTMPVPMTTPSSCMAMSGGTELAAMPAVSESIRPTRTAGLANEVELVDQYAAMWAPTDGAASGPRFVRARRRSVRSARRWR
jgi:hypothetical protein